MLDVLLGNGKMSKKDEVVVYWSDSELSVRREDRSLFYPSPKSLFDDLRKDKIEGSGTSSYFTCPAVSKKFKNTFVFKNALDCSYSYNFSDGNNLINKTSDSAYGDGFSRKQLLSYGPCFLFNLQYNFFAEEPLEAFFTPPYFHQPKYTKYGSIMPGQFDVGQWFRPYPLEIQTWSNSGDLKFENNEPLFYVEFKTDKKIILKRFKFNEQLYLYSKQCTDSTSIFGRGQSLLSRYNRFKDVDLDKKILFEIKNNLLD